MSDDTLYNREPTGVKVVDTIPSESWQSVPVVRVQTTHSVVVRVQTTHSVVVYETLDNMDKDQS